MLIVKIFERGPHDVRPRFGRAPRQAVRFVLDPQRHQLVPGGMEFDLVDSPAKTVVRPQNGWISIGLISERNYAGRADQRAEFFQPLEAPFAPFANDGLFERDVGGERVVVLKRRGLVFDLMRLGSRHRRSGFRIADGRTRFKRGHGVAPYRWLCPKRGTDPGPAAIPSSFVRQVRGQSPFLGKASCRP